MLAGGQDQTEALLTNLAHPEGGSGQTVRKTLSNLLR